MTAPPSPEWNHIDGQSDAGSPGQECEFISFSTPEIVDAEGGPMTGICE